MVRPERPRGLEEARRGELLQQRQLPRDAHGAMRLLRFGVIRSLRGLIYAVIICGERSLGRVPRLRWQPVSMRAARQAAGASFL